jgi:iron complex outermembrane receptor protein
MKSFALLAISALLSCSLMAEPEDALIAFEDTFFDDIPIVLSATRLAQPLTESPVAMTVIDREMIDASGARTIPDLLRLVPGFQVGYFDGNSPVAAFHGHSDENSKRVQVLVDGRSVYVPSLAGVPWQDMLVNIDDIERIEVIRGPNASSYGNNSFFAVVSIITRAAIEDQGHKVKTVLGTHGTIDAYYRFGGHTETLDYRVTVGTENNDGTRLLNDYTAADYLSYRMDYQIDTYNSLSYQGGFKDLNKGDHEPPPAHDIDVGYAYQWLKWDRQFSNQNSISLQYYYNLHDQREFIKSEPIIPPISIIDPFAASAQLDIKSERHDIEFNHYLTLKNIRLVSGLSARQDIVMANDVFDEDAPHRNNLYRAFGHGEYRFNKQWLLDAGLMLEKNDISGSDISPRLSLIHHVNKFHTVRVGVSQATRTPVLWEEYAYYGAVEQITQNGGQPLDQVWRDLLLEGTDIYSNIENISSGNLNSEEITSFEIGYIGRLLNNKLVIDLRVFSESTDQLIDIVEDVPAPNDTWDDVATDFQNTYQTDTEGLELSLDYRPFSDSRIYAYYAYIDILAEGFSPNAYDRTERRLEVSAPTNTYGLMFIQHWDNGVDLGISYFRVGDMDWMDRTGSSGAKYYDRSAQPYEKLDIKLSKTENFGKNRLQYALTFQNLLGDFYDYQKTRYVNAEETIVADATSISGFGSLQDRRFYFDLSLMFN